MAAFAQTILNPQKLWHSRRWRQWVREIVSYGDRTSSLPDTELQKKSFALRYRARSGEKVTQLLPEAFALVREAAARHLRMRHYEVQLLGGIAMQCGFIAEMQTGEGKTLTATLPMYLSALRGKGAHLSTANDYLAQRDADWMRPVYESLGLTVGIVQATTSSESRRAAYACDITYGTAKEFGFDYLRDRLHHSSTARFPGTAWRDPIDSAGRSHERIQRPPFFALVDEADSLLIDEARTPLVISMAQDGDQRAAVAAFRWSASVAPRFQDEEHFTYDADRKTVALTGDGRQLVRTLTKPAEMSSLSLPYINEFVERAIKVNRDFLKDRHYIVRDDKVLIVDEFTGRVAAGRQWRAGIHQAVAAKEGLPITVAAGQTAQITVPDLFAQYEHLAGMTGTALSSERELKRVYQIGVVQIPTHRPCRRQELPTRILPTEETKYTAIVEEVRQMLSRGRPVLIGTRSIDKSERLSRSLAEAGIEHRVLNAQQHAQEAEIVAAAGQAGQITVATNMAGRGTDIRLGPGVADRGGLHVIGTELHDSQRIDRQLAGRAARQGDPGSFRQFLALDDDILDAGLGADRAKRIRARAARSSQSPSQLIRLFRKAQASVERKHDHERRALIHSATLRTRQLELMGQDPFLDRLE